MCQNRGMPEDPLEGLRRLCLALPEATEQGSTDLVALSGTGGG
jgi:hypothetical protein